MKTQQSLTPCCSDFCSIGGSASSLWWL